MAQRTGVPADTFRAWERRYDLPLPERTSGNQRLYSERDIATIDWLRQQTMAGMTISQAVALFRLSGKTNGRHAADPLVGIDLAPLYAPEPDIPRATLGAATARLVEALKGLDGSTADRIIEEALAIGSVDSICVDLLQPTLREIGEQWHRGMATITMEHFASAFVERKLAALFNQSNPNQGRGPILAACVAGEQHDLGLLAIAVLLSRNGFHIIYLGADMPLPDLMETIDRLSPPMVLLSASRDDTAETLRSAITHIKQAARDERPMPVVAYGGSVFTSNPELRTTIDGVYLGNDARESVANTERVFANYPVVIT